jgi:hypothetical protein
VSTLSLTEEIHALRLLLRQKEGGKGVDFATALRRAKRRLPRRVYRQGQKLAQAEAFVDHPKLRLTLDQSALKTAARDLREHLEAIDLADRRKGFWLSVLGGMGFSLLVVMALIVVVLVWRGLI